MVLFLESVSSLKSRVALTTAYAAGLRASEVAGLRVADIDSAGGVILVRHGKGARDRNAMLSAQLLGILRVYRRLARRSVSGRGLDYLRHHCRPSPRLRRKPQSIPPPGVNVPDTC